MAEPENKALKWALFYREKMNFSVIPIIPGDKKPLISWQKYQKTHATQEQITKWWTEHPDANIGIVTGLISNLGVIDVDSDEGRQNIEKFIPDSFMAPTVDTPRGGSHLYCRNEVIVGNKAGVIPGTDFRGEGGYVVAPPSVNSKKKAYQWKEGLKIGMVEIPLLPDAYLKYILKNIYCENHAKSDILRVSATNLLKGGTRDEDIFHIMNCLAKGGYERILAEKLVEIIAKNCDPPFSIKEGMEKIKSAFERKTRSNEAITQLIRDYISEQETNIYLTETNETLQFQQNQQRAASQMAFTRLCKEGLIVKVARGVYKKVEKDCADIDLWSDTTEPINIRYPLGIHELMVTHPKNIIIIAGEPNAGKTAYLLNFALMNVGYDHEVIYFSSEMGPIELKSRLVKFGLPMSEWKKIVWKERAADFGAVIRPNAINIIDFMEIHTDFFKVGMLIKEIFDRLDKGIAIIALQKNKGRDEGLGGARSLEKARLYMAMESGKLKIVKAKNWRNNEINPNGLVRTYKLGGGCNFKTDGDWRKEEK